MKNDASFIYKALKICPLCYDSVKAMFAYQTQEQLKSKSAKGAKSFAVKPMKQGWINGGGEEEEDKSVQKASEVFNDDSVTELDDSECGKSAPDKKAMMMGF